MRDRQAAIRTTPARALFTANQIADKALVNNMLASSNNSSSPWFLTGLMLPLVTIFLCTPTGATQTASTSPPLGGSLRQSSEATAAGPANQAPKASKKDAPALRTETPTGEKPQENNVGSFSRHDLSHSVVSSLWLDIGAQRRRYNKLGTCPD